MIAYHGEPDLKLAYLQRVRSHREADALIQGVGWEDGKGCAVGCCLEAYEHSRYPIELGIPIELAHLEDQIFEGLSPADAQAWPEQFLSAIRVGADLSLVWPRYAVWLLTVELARWRTKESDAVVALYRRRIDGDEPTTTEWTAAAYAARDAAHDAAYAAAYAAADVADYAAYAAADATNTARAGSYRRQRDALLRLLRGAK